MPKSKYSKEGAQGTKQRGSQSRIARACDRCRHRKLSCDATEHSCQQCQKAGTWCTLTDPLTGIPAYRGEHEYLEHTVEKQRIEIQTLLGRLQSLGQDVSDLVHDNKQTSRYTAWRQARSNQPFRPWDIEDDQANHTRELPSRADSAPEFACSDTWSRHCSSSGSLPSTQQPSPTVTNQLPLQPLQHDAASLPAVLWNQSDFPTGLDNVVADCTLSGSYYNIGTSEGESRWPAPIYDTSYMPFLNR